MIQRIIIHDFLKETISAVTEILQDESKHFYFPRNSKRNDRNSRCMAGWMEQVYHDSIFWSGEHISARSKPDYDFRPVYIGIPLTYPAWQGLTISGCQFNLGENELPRMADFTQVRDVWLRAAENFKDGKLDNLIDTRI